MDSRSLFLTANTESIYAKAWLDLKNGPIVVESPPNTLGLVDDFWFRYVTDLGIAGPDKGKGGKYLFLPPDFTGTPPEGYYTFKSTTFGNSFGDARVPGQWRPEARRRRHQAAPADLSAGGCREAAGRCTSSTCPARPFNTIHAMDASFFEEVNEVIQEEPADAIDPETLGLLAAIGIQKGTPFAPDARMQKILTEAAAVGQATVRALAYRCRVKERTSIPTAPGTRRSSAAATSSCTTAHGCSTRARYFFFYATGITPAMAIQKVGAGSAYAAAFVDAKSQPLDGSKTYKLHLPPNIPAKQFWSLVIYDTQTRSMLQTDQPFPSIGSQKKGIVDQP